VGVSTKLRWKRYLNELRHAHEIREMVHQIGKEAAPHFEAYCKEFCRDNNIDFKTLQEHNAQQTLQHREAREGAEKDPNLDTQADGALILHQPSPDEDINSDVGEEYPQQLGDYQMTQDEQEIYEVFNKLFKRVALVLHPDKLSARLGKEEREEKLQMFRESKNSLETRRYFALLDIAEQLSITSPRNYKQQIRWMKKEIGTQHQVAHKEQSTYAYRFAECETNEQRSQLVMSLLLNIFGPQIFHR